MKRIVSAIVLSAGIFLTVYAAEESVNPFQSANQKFAQGKWVTANGWKKGKVKMSQQDGKQMLKVEQNEPAADGAVYCSDKIKVQPGQKIQFIVKVSGKGTLSPSAWCYNAQGKFFKTVYNGRKLTAKSQELSFIVPVPKNTAYVLPAIHLSGGTEAIIEKLEYRTATQQSK